MLAWFWGPKAQSIISHECEISSILWPFGFTVSPRAPCSSYRQGGSSITSLDYCKRHIQPKKGGHNTRCQQGDTRIHGSMRPRYPSKLPSASVLRDRRKGPFDPNLLRIWERCTRHTKKKPWRVPVKRMFLGAKFWSEKNVPTRAVVGMLWGSKASWGKHCSFPTKDSKINRNHPSRYPGTQTATWALGQLYYKVKVLVARTNSRRGGAEKRPSTSNLGKYLEFFRRLGCFDRYVMQY